MSIPKPEWWMPKIMPEIPDGEKADRNRRQREIENPAQVPLEIGIVPVVDNPNPKKDDDKQPIIPPEVN